LPLKKLDLSNKLQPVGAPDYRQVPSSGSIWAMRVPGKGELVTALNYLEFMVTLSTRPA
ncbi:hypothetical protein J6590_087107, partial [Homalodisca vitripennis]